VFVPERVTAPPLMFSANVAGLPPSFIFPLHHGS
jgi:hypothetical protein